MGERGTSPDGLSGPKPSCSKVPLQSHRPDQEPGALTRLVVLTIGGIACSRKPGIERRPDRWPSSGTVDSDVVSRHENPGRMTKGTSRGYAAGAVSGQPAVEVLARAPWHSISSRASVPPQTLSTRARTVSASRSNDSLGSLRTTESSPYIARRPAKRVAGMDLSRKLETWHRCGESLLFAGIVMPFDLAFVGPVS